MFYTIEVSDNARQLAERHGADILALDALDTLGIGPLNEATVPEPVEADRSHHAAVLVYTSGTPSPSSGESYKPAGRDRCRVRRRGGGSGDAVRQAEGELDA